MMGMLERLYSDDDLIEPQDAPIWQTMVENHVFDAETAGRLLLLLSSKLQKQFMITGSSDDLDASISSNRQAMGLIPPSDAEYWVVLGNLGNSLFLRYNLNGAVEDLEEATSLQQKVLSLPNIDDRPGALINLANSLMTGYMAFGDIEHLEGAVLLQREALSLCEPGSDRRSMALTNLATALHRKYEQDGDSDHLKESIALHREALSLYPLGHRDRSMALNNLASALHTSYKQLGEASDLDEAIALHREALILRPPGHSDRSMTLTNLGHTLHTRYVRSGDIKDLEESISLHRESLPLYPPEHPERYVSLLDLGISLSERYDRLGEMKDLEETILVQTEALSLSPPGQPSHGSLINNLSASLSAKYERTGEESDLQRSILLQRAALDILPHGHPERQASLNELGITMSRRYDRFHEMKDLEEAVSLLRESLSLRPHGHPERALSLNNLANTLMTRYEVLKDLWDLETSIVLLREALSLCPSGHSRRTMTLTNLALALRLKYERPLPSQDPIHDHEHEIEEMQQYVTEAVQDRCASVLLRLTVARHWAHEALTPSAFRLSMHAHSLTLLQQLLVVNPDIVEQQSKLLDSSSDLGKLASQAAAEAITAGDLELAVVMLDQGRSLLLNTLQRYRFPVDRLRKFKRELADELQSVGTQLEELSTKQSGKVHANASTLDYALNTQRQLLERWDELLILVRAVPGFEDFLSPPSFPKLQAAAKDGPIIVLIAPAAQTECTAIIVTETGTPALIPLPHARPSLLLETHVELLRHRAERNRPKEQATLLHVLRLLWEGVVSPIAEHLTSIGVQHHGRVWWCPTSMFCLFPLHAAGLYDGSRASCFQDLFVSSYTPTLSDLLRAKANNLKQNQHPSLLFVGDMGRNLGNIGEELSIIKEIRKLQVEALVNDEAQPEKVLSRLSVYPWIHLSCHGFVLPDKPLDSYFQLQERHLTVKDIIDARLDKAEFAFLSACHSAAAGFQLPDENIHLAAALQFAGFHSVVGTMWEMFDAEGPRIARDFYKKMMALGGQHSNAAEALQYATKQCRKRGVHPERWAMFIHMGA